MTHARDVVDRIVLQHAQEIRHARLRRTEPPQEVGLPSEVKAKALRRFEAKHLIQPIKAGSDYETTPNGAIAFATGICP